MNFKLTATLTHKSFDEPVVHYLYFTGPTFESIMDQIETQDCHLFNLRHYRKTNFKDARGVRHKWVLEELKKK